MTKYHNIEVGLNSYPVTSNGKDKYISTWEGYSGVIDDPDRHLIGYGETHQKAIDSLIEETNEIYENDERVIDYLEYAKSRTEALAEDYAETKREERQK